MGLREEVLAESNRQGAVCRVQTLLRSLSDKDRAELQAVMDDDMITSVALEKYYKKRNGNVSSSSFSRHRRGACNCGD
jgi:hypothetical protein